MMLCVTGAPPWTAHDVVRAPTEERHLVGRMCEDLRHLLRRNVTIEGRRYTFRIKKYNTSICLTPKAGSTFLKQLIYYLSDPKDLTNNKTNLIFKSFKDKLDYVTKIQTLVLSLERFSVHRLPDTPVRSSLDNYTQSSGLKVISVRNPYSRLFSAYIDKIYVPLEWQYVKRNFILNTTDVHESSPKYCYVYDVSFQTFLNNVIYLLKRGKADRHWAPINDLCAPCSANPHIIIRQETYTEDVMSLLRFLNVSPSEYNAVASMLNRSQGSLDREKTVIDLVSSSFKRLNKSSHINLTCVPHVAEKMWHALQMTGHVPRQLMFPRAAVDWQSPTLKNLVAAFANRTRDMTLSRHHMSTQRQFFLKRAYRSIDRNTVQEIQKLYYTDFKLFGYSIDIT